MRVPTIHMNGSNGEQLLKDVINAAQQAHQLQLALAEASPNGRDYYPQGPAAYNEAAHEHASRLARVKAVQDELWALAEAISNQL